MTAKRAGSIMDNLARVDATHGATRKREVVVIDDDDSSSLGVPPPQQHQVGGAFVVRVCDNRMPPPPPRPPKQPPKQQHVNVGGSSPGGVIELEQERGSNPRQATPEDGTLAENENEDANEESPFEVILLCFSSASLFADVLFTLLELTAECKAR
jgi:hypothetical protein